MAKKEPKEPKEKKQKKVEQPKKERPPKRAKGEGGAEGKPKSKLPLPILLAAAAVLVAAVVLVVIFVILPKGEEEEPDPEPTDTATYYELPEAFEVGEQKVPAPVPVEAANVQALKSVQVTYRYIDLTDAGAEAKAYASLLRKDGFSVVTEEFVRTSEPDYGTAEGHVLLAKDLPKQAAAPAGEGDAQASAAPAPEEQPDMVLTMDLTWSKGTCVIVGDQAEGKVTSPPREEQPNGGASMSMAEAADYLRGLDPSVLELSGTSMDSYRVYALDGSVLVNGQPCVRLKVYDGGGEDAANEVVGSYLMTRDGAHLYVLDEVEGTVRELTVKH